jgi:hypothetical protein
MRRGYREAIVLEKAPGCEEALLLNTWSSGAELPPSWRAYYVAVGRKLLTANKNLSSRPLRRLQQKILEIEAGIRYG